MAAPAPKRKDNFAGLGLVPPVVAKPLQKEVFGIPVWGYAAAALPLGMIGLILWRRYRKTQGAK